MKLKSMKPLLLPIRVMACAFDPSTLYLTRQADPDSSNPNNPNRKKTKKQGHQWSWSPPDYAGLTSDKKKRSLRPIWPKLLTDTKPPSLRGEEKALKRAICVSWSPPTGWGNSLEREDPNSMPELPDRWLVMRIIRPVHDAKGWVSKDAKSVVNTWIVDAGVPTDSSTSASVVITGKDGRYGPQAIGVVRTLEAAMRAGPDEWRVGLTVQGPRQSPDPTFAVFVPSNLNNLSCIDTLEGVSEDALKNGAISYFVAGWYRDPKKNDPLWTLKQAGKSDAEIRDLLGLEERADDRLHALSDRCIAHGTLAYVDYWNERSYLGAAFGAPESKTVYDRKGTCDYLQHKVGFGQTAEDALAAIMSDVSSSDDEKKMFTPKLFRVLRALLTDQLTVWDEAGAADLVRYAERRATFLSASSGTEWTVRLAEGPEEKKTLIQANGRGANQAEGQEDNRVSASAAPVPGGEGKKPGPTDQKPVSADKKPVLTDKHWKALHHLNAAQCELDEVAGNLASEAETLYTAWWMHQSGNHRMVEGQLQKFIDAHTVKVRTLKKRVTDLEKGRREQRRRLQQTLDTAFGPGRLKVVKTPAPGFFVPKEPAVALRNVGPRVPGAAFPAGGRRIEEVASSRAGGTYEHLRLAEMRDALKPYRDPFHNPDQDVKQSLEAALAALADEAAFVEEAVASLVRDRGKGALYGKKSNVAEWQERNRLLDSALDGAGMAPVGSPQHRRTAAETAKQAKILFASPSGRMVPLAHIGAMWGQQPWLPLYLDWEVHWSPTTPDGSRKLRGRSILAHRPQRLIQRRLELLDEAVGSEALRSLQDCRNGLNEVAKWDVLAQTLSGIHQQLLWRNDALPRIQPDADDLASKEMRELLENTSLGSPDPGQSGFSVDRKGSLEILRLWVVDQFGQAYTLDHPTVNTFERQGEKEKGTTLPRRLLEPMRLAARFTLPADATTPVLGWLLPSLLDRAFIVYDASGDPLGMVLRLGAGEQPTTARKGTRWMPAHPKAPATVEEVRKKGPRLGELVGELVEADDAGARFDALMDHVGTALARTLPSRAADVFSSASMIGRPLALVGVKVGLERKGGPILSRTDLSVAPAITKLVSSYDAAVKALEDARKLPKVTLTIGSPVLPDDGVIGYFGTTVACPLRKTARFDALGTPAPRHELEVPASGGSQSLELTLLLDPHGKAYFETDILPVTSIAMPPEWYEDVLKRLPAVLRVEPILVSSIAKLRAILQAGVPPVTKPGGPVVDDRPRVELPIPTNTRKRAEAIAGSRFLVIDGAIADAPDTPPRIQSEVLVDSIAPIAAVGEADVAALGGLLVL